MEMDFKNMDAQAYLKTIQSGTIDLILTDPPYIISRKSGMDTHYNNVKENEKNQVTNVKTAEEWNEYAEKNNICPSKKELYMKYGTIYGKKYCVKTDYGEWDQQFTIEELDSIIKEYVRVLKQGGTMILFFDVWKIETLKEILEKHKLKQIRMIEWIKTNPQPLNSKVNYLTNAREIALTAVKGTKPTFHSQYDNGIYMFPLQGGKERFHPTQKSVKLFEELIKKHSDEGGVVLDTFIGGGTTIFAAKNTNRICKGCEKNESYFEKVSEALKKS